MEVGATVWVRAKGEEETWIPGIVLEKSSEKPCTVKIEINEGYSDKSSVSTFKEDRGGSGASALMIVRSFSL